MGINIHFSGGDDAAFDTFATMYPHEAFDAFHDRFCNWMRANTTPDATDEGIEALVNSSRNEQHNLKIEATTEPVKNDYTPFGPDWHADVMKMRKADIVHLWKGSLEILRAMETRPDIGGLQAEAFEWANETFGYFRNPVFSINHLKKEANELIQAIERLQLIMQQPKPENRDMIRLVNDAGSEYADCFLLILDAASSSGITAAELIRFAKAKLEINKNRKWGERDENGVVEHIREEAVNAN